MDKLLEVKNIKKYFPASSGFMNTRYVKAVDDVTLHIGKGETLGLVGESGCGKTTVGRTILRLHEPTSGEIIYNGENITHVKMLPYRRKMQIVFQDPFASLDPRMTVGDIVGEAIDIHKLAANKKERNDKIIKMLEHVGLNSEHANRFPHEFSGGQRQRIGIARALAVDPEFIVCDEPVSALDVSIQAQILNLLKELQRDNGLTYIFITHDLAVVNHFANNILVMYLGLAVENAPAEELFENPLHPYTKALLSAVLVPELGANTDRIQLRGELSSPIDPPDECRFAGRCNFYCDECDKGTPPLIEVSPDNFVACHRIGPGGNITRP